MYIFSAFLATVVVLPLVINVYFPYFWMDCLYMVKIIRALIKFARRTMGKRLFFVLDKFYEQVAKHPEKPFIIFENETFSYRETDAKANKVAQALKRHSRLQAGDTAALYMGNEPAFIFTWLALEKLGCSVALLNHNVRSKSLLHCFGCCGAKVLIAAADLTDAVREVLPALQEQDVTVFVMAKEQSTQGMVTLLDKVEAASDEPIPLSARSNITLKSPAVYIYTSGTTGLPKAAVVNQHRLLIAMAVLTTNGVTPKDVVYINLPLYHAAGFIIGFLGSTEIGTTIVLRRKFSASQFWDDCRKYNVTVIQYIGEILRYLCNTPKRDNDRDHKVRLAIGNGVRANVWKEFLDRFGNITVREFYAATEGNIGFVNYTGKIGAAGRINFLHKKLYSYTLIKYDTEKDEPVRDSRGLCVEVPVGETGLLVSRITRFAPFSGYARNAQQTEKKVLRDVFQKGDAYFNTGDLLRSDHDNFIYFQDRVGDTYRWKGENVATTEVSDVLTMLDFIEEANVYGVEVKGHEGRVGMAAVTLKKEEQFDGGTMFNHVASYLPAYARPRFIRIQSSLELTGTFKQMKLKLVQEGFGPAVVPDPLFILDESQKTYIPMTEEINKMILSGSMKL
ncbi:long-chain fatty acid transport protein 2-like isoform X1 [Paramormyrops kingsleyae]|uniref:long-chain fatty acid transport protein 2-like isoform X1 n=1 Tax=Paramormyrops kingsleyae TaxID=1676925 RepID=UPI003B979B1C